jgi:hypothetical protein
VTRIRKVIRDWSPAFAVPNRIVAITAGRVLGYPARNIGSGNGTLGGCTTVVWAPV